MKKFFAVVLVSVLTGCAPAIKDHMKAATDQRLSATSTGAHRLGPPASFDFLDWSPGQWVTFRTISGKERHPTFTKVRVVEATADGVWLETESQSYYDRTVTKVLYSRMPKSADEALDVVIKIITQIDGEEPQEFDFTENNPLITFMKKTMASHVDWGHTPLNAKFDKKEDVTVSAGSFAGCGVFTTTVRAFGTSTTVTSLVHPGVPLGGTVRSVSADGDFVMELLDFGMN